VKNRPIVFHEFRLYVGARIRRNTNAMPVVSQAAASHGKCMKRQYCISWNSTTPTPTPTSSRGFSQGCKHVCESARVSVSVSWNSSYTVPQWRNHGRKSRGIGWTSSPFQEFRVRDASANCRLPKGFKI